MGSHSSIKKITNCTLKIALRFPSQAEGLNLLGVAGRLPKTLAGSSKAVTQQTTPSFYLLPRCLPWHYLVPFCFSFLSCFFCLFEAKVFYCLSRALFFIFSSRPLCCPADSCYHCYCGCLQGFLRGNFLLPSQSNISFPVYPSLTRLSSA